jgi:hypothetical protein
LSRARGPVKNPGPTVGVLRSVLTRLAQKFRRASSTAVFFHRTSFRFHRIGWGNRPSLTIRQSVRTLIDRRRATCCESCKSASELLVACSFMDRTSLPEDVPHRKWDCLMADRHVCDPLYSRSGSRTVDRIASGEVIGGSGMAANGGTGARDGASRKVCVSSCYFFSFGVKERNPIFGPWLDRVIRPSRGLCRRLL